MLFDLHSDMTIGLSHFTKVSPTSAPDTMCGPHFRTRDPLLIPPGSFGRTGPPPQYGLALFLPVSEHVHMEFLGLRGLSLDRTCAVPCACTSAAMMICSKRILPGIPKVRDETRKMRPLVCFAVPSCKSANSL